MSEQKPESGNPLLMHLATHPIQETAISLLSWSPDGKQIACWGASEELTVLDVDSGHQRYVSQPRDVVNAFAWSPAGDDLAICYRNSLVRQKPQTNSTAHLLMYFGLDRSHTVCWSASINKIYAAKGSEITISELDDSPSKTLAYEESNAINLLVSHPSKPLMLALSMDGLQKYWLENNVSSGWYSGQYICAAWHPTSEIIFAGTSDGRILIHDSDLMVVSEIEGQTGGIKSIHVSSDGHFLASVSGWEARIIRLATSETVLTISLADHEWSGVPFAFDPTGPRYAYLSKEGVVVVQYNPYNVATVSTEEPNLHYRSAKVVLVGDAHVGKSGLGIVLSGQKFRPTDSTHGRYIRRLNYYERKLLHGSAELREVYLWDLAGQPGYRLIHQMHLDEVAIALIVFECTKDYDPFSGVNHWARAVKLASQQRGGFRGEPKLIMVASQLDRGAPVVNRQHIEAYMVQHGVSNYVATSAKEGTGIAELSKLIESSINWNTLPQVTSTQLFYDIRSFLYNQQSQGQVLASLNSLYHSFRTLHSPTGPAKQLEAQFETCIRVAHSRGIVKLFSFGNLVLLRPEYLDAYASALINAARTEADGLGCIKEDDARNVRFDVPSNERLSDIALERLLCTAMVEELIRGEVALLENTSSGSQLVFPSQLTKDFTGTANTESSDVTFAFTGPLNSVYATLIVRLSQSSDFVREDMWQNGASYRAGSAMCSMQLLILEDDSAKLAIWYGKNTNIAVRQQFEAYIESHLKRRSLAGSVRRIRTFACPNINCGDKLLPSSVQKRLERGFDFCNCPVCDTKIDLHDYSIHTGQTMPLLTRMNSEADKQREYSADLVSVTGELNSPTFKDWAGDNMATIALVFTDIKGSTSLQQQIGNEGWRGIRRRHFSTGDQLIRQLGGYCIKTIGDAMMAAFRTAPQALTFGLEFQKTTGDERIEIRVAMNVGPVGVETHDAYGDMVNLTARIQSRIKGPELWASDIAYRHIKQEGSSRHRGINWREHRRCTLKDYGPQTLWSISQSPSGSSRYRR